MKIISAQQVTDSTLEFSNVAENDSTEWTSAATFAADAKCMVTTTANGATIATHLVYKSIAGANQGNDPSGTTGPDFWDVIESTNRFKMFDTTLQQQTQRVGGINISLLPGKIITGLSVVNADCETVIISMSDPTEGTVYNKTFNMVSDSGITSWYDYFFTPIVRDTDLAVLDLPPYSQASTAVSFTGSGDVKVGALVIGVTETIGVSQLGASFGILDYSLKATDADGNVTITKGAYSDTVDVDVIIDTVRFAQVKKTLTAARSVPTIWILEENTQGLIIYGYFREFSILMTNPSVSFTTLEIEGLT